MADTIRKGAVTITLVEGDIEKRLGRLIPAASDLSHRVASGAVQAARSRWPVSGDRTPSRDAFDVTDNRDGTSTVRNASSYATEIRGGETVRVLLDEPLEAAAAALGAAMPAVIGEVMRG